MKKTNKNNIIYLLRFLPKLIKPFFILLIIIQPSCKKLVGVDSPYTSINASNVFTNNETAAAVLTSIYTNLSKYNSTQFANGTNDFTSLSLFASLSSDELSLYDITNPRYSIYYQNALTSIGTSLSADYWKIAYPIIFVANSAIEGLQTSISLTLEIKQQLIGEAKFIRAFCYFYLVNLYGDIPLALNTDWQLNASLIRTPKDQVYDQIIADLKDAQSLLSSNYLKSDALSAYSNSTAERVRPTKWAANFLLSRVYLYIRQFANAESEATTVINNSSTFSLVSLNNVFLKNSKEAIWQLQGVGTGVNSNTGEGKVFVLPTEGPGTSNPVYLSNYLINSFDSGDQRKVNWIGSVTPTPPGTSTYYYPNKYKIGAINTSTQEYCTIFRLAELYLIRAEARAQQGNLSTAISDLNVIRTRANLPNYRGPNITSAVLSAILHERQVELFTEWGHRWLDIKRTNIIDSIMNSVTPAKGGVWKYTSQLYPIPLSEIQKAPQLHQNTGY
jgi:hypothetical protein